MFSLQEYRHDEFVRTKKEIIACMNDLEQNPETSFEMDVMCEDEEAFCLSNDNITAVKLLLSQVSLLNVFRDISELSGQYKKNLKPLFLQLQKRKTENELICSSFQTKIQELWERLQVPQEERESFSEHMLGSKKKNVEAVRKLPRLFKQQFFSKSNT